MVGGTRIHRQIHERALVEMKEREEFLSGEENTSPAARTLFVSLDRADAIIEGAACFASLAKRAGLDYPAAYNQTRNPEMAQSEIIFSVQESPEGGYQARAL